MSTKSADVEAAVKSLDAPTQDILMKYIYRGFEVPAEGSSAQLLTWHQKVLGEFHGKVAFFQKNKTWISVKSSLLSKWIKYAMLSLSEMSVISFPV